MIRWFGKSVAKEVRKDLRRKVLKVAILLEILIKGSMKRGIFRSKPGEVPRVETGRLKEDIQHELHDTLPIARVGTFLPYGRFLELGTKKMAPRPFLRPALHKAKPFIEKIFSE